MKLVSSTRAASLNSETTVEDHWNRHADASRRTEICTDSLRDLVYQIIEAGMDYRKMKEKIIAWTSNIVAANNVEAADMDVGNIGKGNADCTYA